MIIPEELQSLLQSMEIREMKKRIVIINKIFIIISTFLFITGCEHYYDYGTYSADITCKNFTSEPINFSVYIDKKDPRNEYQSYTGIIKIEIESLSEEKKSVSWVPGKFSVVTINGDTDEDARIFFAYKIEGMNSQIITDGEIGFNLIENTVDEIHVFETYIQNKYTNKEFLELKNIFSKDEMELFVNYYFYDEYGDLSSIFRPSSLGYKTEEENRALFLNFDAIMKKYSLDSTLNFITFTKK